MSLAAAGGMMLTACDSFIDVPPTGVIDEKEAYKEPGLCHAWRLLV